MPYRIDFSPNLAEKIKISIHKENMLNALRKLTQDISCVDCPSQLEYFGKSNAGRECFIVNGIIVRCSIDTISKRCTILSVSV